MLPNSFQEHLASRIAAFNSEKSGAPQETCIIAPAATHPGQRTSRRAGSQGMSPLHGQPPHGRALPGGPRGTCGLPVSVPAPRRPPPSARREPGVAGDPRPPPRGAGGRGRLAGWAGEARGAGRRRQRRPEAALLAAAAALLPLLGAAGARRLRTGPRARGGSGFVCMCVSVCECVRECVCECVSE